MWDIYFNAKHFRFNEFNKFNEFPYFQLKISIVIEKYEKIWIISIFLIKIGKSRLQRAFWLKNTIFKPDSGRND